MKSQKALRSDALKVISFAMTRCTKLHAVDFIQNASGLSLIFGYLMRDDPTAKRNKKP